MRRTRSEQIESGFGALRSHIAVPALDGRPDHRRRDGGVLVILLTGGTKKRQQRGIGDARAYWQDYKDRKRGRR
jgi:hypothetical protein